MESCDGVVASITLVAAVFAFPFPRGLAPRLLGAFAGVAAVQGINVLRIALLVLIAPYLDDRSFALADLIAGQSFLILLALAVWLVWARNAMHRAGGGRHEI